MQALYFVILLILAINLIKTLDKFVNYFNSKVDSRFMNAKLKNGLISRFDLSNITRSQFEAFCHDYLTSLGFYEITEIDDSINNGSIFLAYKFNKPHYVYCYQSSSDSLDNTKDIYESIDRPSIQKFIGSMYHDNIKDGLILSNGDLKSTSKEYLDSVKPSYSIEEYTGCGLSKNCWIKRFSYE